MTIHAQLPLPLTAADGAESFGRRVCDRAPAGGPRRDPDRRGPVIYAEGAGLLEVREVLWRLAHLDFPHLRGPLRMGDRIAMYLLDTVNGRWPFCDHCGQVKAGGRSMETCLCIVGRRCACGGYYLPGAAMEAAWRTWVGLDAKGDEVG